MKQGFSPSQDAAWPGLSPEETTAWLARYRRHSRWYAWGFFAALIPIVFVVIWASMGELNADVFRSLGFFALVTAALAYFSRRRETASWSGEVRDKYLSITKESGEDDRTDVKVVRYFLDVVTEKGKNIRIRAPETVFEYFEIGDKLFKAPSLNWPEKTVLTEMRRMCPCCGAILQKGDVSCARCGAPVLDHGAMRRFSASR